MTIGIYLGALLVLIIHPSDVKGEQLEQFAKALMLNLDKTKPALVFDLEQNHQWMWTSWQTASTLIAATNDLVEIESITINLKWLLDQDEIDFLFFVDPIAEGFATNLSEKLGRIRPKVAMVIPYGYATTLPLRLDSRIFFYKISGMSVTVFEKYLIRQG